MKFTALLAASALVVTSFAAIAPVQAFDDDTSLDVPGKNPLKHCQDPADDVLELKSVDLSPNPPKAGESLNITATGYLKDDIEEGAKISLQVKYGLITIIRMTRDLCDNVENVDLECPIKKGELSLTKEVELPAEIPPGKYTVVADLVTKDNDKVTCLTAQVVFSREKKDL